MDLERAKIIKQNLTLSNALIIGGLAVVLIILFIAKLINFKFNFLSYIKFKKNLYVSCLYYNHLFMNIKFNYLTNKNLLLLKLSIILLCACRIQLSVKCIFFISIECIGNIECIFLIFVLAIFCKL